MFLLNSRLILFTAAYLRRHPFSRSYGVILPSSFTRVLSSTLGYSPHLPVSVYSTGNNKLTLEAFLVSVAPLTSLILRLGSSHNSVLIESRICLRLPPYYFHLHFHPQAKIYFLRHHFELTAGTGIFNLFAIDYAYSASP